MPKASGSPKTQYVCDSCGAAFPKWSGQCSNCGEWNTLVETVTAVSSSAKSRNSSFYAAVSDDEFVSAATVWEKGGAQEARLTTGLYELDRVFGDGVVLGSVSLVGGQPGIGKSTILTQFIINVLKNQPESQVIYVAGEESPSQITQRIRRMLGESAQPTEELLARLFLSASTDVDATLERASQEKPSILVVDSIQTMFTRDLTGLAGSVGQLRESTVRLVSWAKREGVPTFLVGHVTKEGEIAGPKVLEHIVDTVIEISGERTGEVRVIRSLKNRFGPTDEVGLVRLTAEGVVEVANPAEVFMEEKSLGEPGSALAVCLEGSRPVVVEVQALVVPSFLPSPRRVTRGIPLSKVHLLLAVLQKHAKLNLSNADVYVSVVGNLEFQDPGIDLALAAALISAKREKAWPKGMVFSGEIGLLGEVRRVLGVEKRRNEAKRLGYSKFVASQDVSFVSQLPGRLGPTKEK